MEKNIVVWVLLFLLQLFNDGASASHFSIVDSLPGLHFNNRLPFHLETGYVGVGKNEEVQLFYYFLKSESDPKNDPLLIFLSGGPGCSSLIPIVSEIGPLRFVEHPYNGSLPTFVLNPHAWTKIANVIFLDQPANTGFSYATTSAAYKYTDVQACAYVNEFVRKWLSDHPEFIVNPFYVAGNSYSGTTVPIVTQFISDGNTAGNEPYINLEGYLLGNPITYPADANYRIPFSHGMALISDELYKSLEKNCKGDYVNIDPKNEGCADDFRTYEQMVSNINREHILRPYCGSDDELRGQVKLSGQRKLLEHKLISLHGDNPCASNWQRLLKYWANDVEVQQALHVRMGIIGDWARCRRSIFNRDHNFTITVNDSVPYHAILSVKGYRSLIYSGDHDLTVPFQSTQAWIRSLNYSILDDWRPWFMNGQVAGYTRYYSNKMTFATVKGSGHTVGTYTPEESFVMFKRWISHEPL